MQTLNHSTLLWPQALRLWWLNRVPAAVKQRLDERALDAALGGLSAHTLADVGAPNHLIAAARERCERDVALLPFAR